MNLRLRHRENGVSGRGKICSSCLQPGMSEQSIPTFKPASTHIIPHNLADICRSGICNRNDLNKFGILDGCCGDRSEERLQINVPVGT
jgi:hypothetical protein